MMRLMDGDDDEEGELLFAWLGLADAGSKLDG